ncbi:hypothetical protein [Micromonospora echinofusca]|uniref:Uncharacterized protein n=1 Tax=Micromonospora echinofusca TaxID=47858 RepID=A0ABS3VU18_MICEH|nr:hypothetical protein [Micromonospora echinofusca]MBO4207889.1 hypothetical protein [Micromonospora echinofusca]
MTPEQYQRVQQARMLLLRRCMSRFGIRLALPEIRLVVFQRAPELAGWLDSREPARYGYRGPAGYQSDLFAAATRGLTKALTVPEAYTPVFEGTVEVFAGTPVPSGGCDGQVRRELDGPEGVPLRAVIKDDRAVPWTALADLELEATRRVGNDSRYLGVQRAWSECMRRTGYEYASTADAEADTRWVSSVSITSEEPERAVSADEIATATADQRCRTEVNLSGLAIALHSLYQEELIAARHDQLDGVRQLLTRQALNSAATIRLIG